MSSRAALIAIVFALSATAIAGRAAALCTADQIISQEGANCPPGNGACLITGTYTIDDGCTIDFGTRSVTLLSSGRFTIGLMGINAGTARIRAGDFIVHSLIDGVGHANGARGALLHIDLTGNFQVSDNGQIDVSGNSSAGEIIVNAGGLGLIQGQLKAQFLNQGASGGLIDITTGGDLTSTQISVISATGGNDSDGGGEIDLTAGGNLTVATNLNVEGLDGGFVGLTADGHIIADDISASGEGDAGIGGCVDILAGAGIDMQGSLTSRGATGSFMTGGCGGLICLDGGFGDVTIGATALIDADGASPDGGGGQITILARGSLVLNGELQARGPDGETCGGDLCVETGHDVTIAATAQVDASGGDSGGEVEILAAHNMAINRSAADVSKITIDASGRSQGSLGGDITLHAGQHGSGSLTLNAAIDVGSNAPCSVDNGCGEAGNNELVGCNIDLTPFAALRARGPVAGDNDLIAREQLTLRGATVDARTTRAAMGTTGTNRFVYRAAKPPIVLTSSVQPPADTLVVSLCPDQGPTQPPCLNPCPVCGNGTVEFPEECDKGVIPPTSCSGCSIYCELEDCDDHLVCTGDSCNPQFGCLNRPTPLCKEPTATVTGTPPTATITGTPTATPTVSATASTTASRTPTETATATPSVTVTPTASATGTATATDTASATLSATPTATATQTTTPSATATASTTATATPTGSTTGTATTTPPACAGDCSGDGKVTVNELITGVNIALSNLPVTSCLPFDRNGDGKVVVNELVVAVNAALAGC